jgi:uracil-DNA glycosylase
VQRGVAPPPSLKNIFKEAMADVNIKPPSHGNLECWAKQGVLMLNTCLTVRQGDANSHQGKGWEQFTDAAIKVLSAKVLF